MNYIRDLQLQTHLNVVHSQLYLEECHCVKLFYLNIAVKTLRVHILGYRCTIPLSNKASLSDYYLYKH